MTNYKEILRLARSGGFSQREVAASLHVSRNTVSSCLSRAAEKGIPDPVPESMTNQELAKLLFPNEERKAISSSYLMPNLAKIVEDLKKPHVTKKLLWKEYVTEAASCGLKPYKTTQFNALISDYVERHNISLKRDRVPGEVLELDWSGSAIILHGNKPGLEKKCHLFVAAFPYSGYFFAEAFADEKIHSWVKAITDSLEFFGGVPVILRPDNTKTATIKADKYEPDLNETMIELSEHYGTVTIPARVRKPRDKNVVENSVGFASTYIIAALRDQVFYSLEELNAVVFEKVDELNAEPFTKKEGSRVLLFEHGEKECLLPLPSRRFELFERTVAKVAPDYHVQFSKCYYSVHPKYIGEKVRVKASLDTVFISLSNGEEIAQHKRCLYNGQRSTDPSHIPPAHQEVLGWSGAAFREEARRVGPCCEILIDRILTSRQYEVQSYKTCRGVLNLKRKVGPTRLEMAAKEAVNAGIVSYKSVKVIAETIDTVALPNDNCVDDESEFFLTHSDKKEVERC